MRKIPSLYKWLKDNNIWDYTEHQDWGLPPLEAIKQYIREFPDWLEIPIENVIDC